jgi:type II restriction/modification system DNA methylase subunit YeeA
MHAADFIAKWRATDLTERAAAQSHFLDLCALLDEKAPAEADPSGEHYAFEKGATKTTGGEGWADVWKQGCFGWEYKGRGKDLRAAYAQLQRYAPALENPPLLIVCDLARFEIHTNWTNTVSQTYEIARDELTDGRKLRWLKWAFSDPEQLKPGLTRQTLTEEAAGEFARLAQRLRDRGYPSQQVAHFINRLVFCMFAEDVDLLPGKTFGRMLDSAARAPAEFEALASSLFAAMREGGRIGFERVDWFNGGLFDDDRALPLGRDDIALVRKAAERDWAEIDPSIFGTLFERGLDPDKRSQLGAHYTDRDKIGLIVEPVISRPWLAEWAAARAEIEKLLRQAEIARDLGRAGPRTRLVNEANALYRGFLDRLRAFRVLDPACGSGNFLYLALLALKDIEHRVAIEAEALGLAREFPRIGPEAVKGIEINPYAAELARVTVWIGEIQWMRRNGFDVGRNPILKPLDTIECRDAILNPDGTEAEWPAADVVIGNPPFLGGKLLRTGLGDDYVNRLFAAYAGRVPAEADLVVYWFFKAWKRICSLSAPGGGEGRGEVGEPPASDEIPTSPSRFAGPSLSPLKGGEGETRRAGLVATNSIRGGANRQVLDRIAQGGTIFEAWDDEPWILDGAAVRVSLICFAKRKAPGEIRLDGRRVPRVNPDLTGAIDFTTARRLAENGGVAFMGDTKGGAFDVPGELAREWLQLPLNPNGRPNSDVLRPWMNGMDLTRRPSGRWIIDFGWEMSERKAALYEAPFAYALEHIRPVRLQNRREAYAKRWWRHVEPRPGMWRALRSLGRAVATPRVGRHRVFAFVEQSVVPDCQLILVTRDDDASFGVLHSRFHEAWALALCTWLGVGNDPRYTPSTTFETFPFPEGLTPNIPAAAYADDPQAAAIAAAARRLDELRRAWLNPPDLVELVPEVVPGFPDRVVPASPKAAAILKKRTLTNLYNERPAWLDNAHRALDAAVAAAYGWPADIADEDALGRLLALNRERAAAGR